MKPSLSIQILNYNGKKFLKECIDSLLKQNYPNFEIILVDNNSSDNSLDFMKENYKKEIKNKKIKPLPLKKNYGFAEGNNIAYKKSNADYVLLLNNDTYIRDKNFLKKLVNFSLKNNSDLTGAWECPINQNKKRIIRKNYPSLNILGNAMGDILKENESSVSGGGCLLINKNQIKLLFPPEYFLYGEDVFLGWKNSLLDKKIKYNKEAIYYHYGSGSAKKSSPFICYYAERNRIYNLLIFYKKSTLIKILPLLLLEEFFKFLYYIKSPRHSWAIIKGNFFAFSSYKTIREYRREIQKNRKLSDKEIISRMTHKLFPEQNEKIKILNQISRLYCRILKIKTYD